MRHDLGKDLQSGAKGLEKNILRFVVRRDAPRKKKRKKDGNYPPTHTHIFGKFSKKNFHTPEVCDTLITCGK